MPDSNDVGKRLRELSKDRNKKERWIRTRMWFSTFMSYLFPDMGYIPDNIGNDIFIGNNQYVTKNSISTVILVKEFSEVTPVSFMSKMLEDVKSKIDGVIIDFTLKNHSYDVDLRDRGLENRRKQWIKTLDNDRASDMTKTRAARLLYTYDVAVAREKMFKTHFYITIRAQNGSTLRAATTAVRFYLDSCLIEYKIVKSNLKDHLEYIAAMSDKSQGKMKAFPYSIQSALTISELLPSIQGLNDPTGTFLGLDRTNKAPYYINFRTSSAGKNIYVVGPTGEGKTFLVLNWVLDGYATDFCICLMDLKGNDYTSFVQATGGKTLSMSSDSVGFVNSFVLNKAKCNTVPSIYYNEMFKLSKMKMMIMCDLDEKFVSRGESLLESFLRSMYAGIGVLPDNPNTWERSKDLHPFIVFEKFKAYLSPEVKRMYSDVADTMVSRLQMYIDKNGSNSHIFRDEYRLEEVLDAKVLRFSFGMLESGKLLDVATFKMKLMDMKLLNDEFIVHKKSQGLWTMKVLEESQVAEDYLLKMYVEEMTLRRSQNQVTILLGNSVSALQHNPIARPLLDNLNILAIGPVPSTSREFLVNEYGLDKYRKSLSDIYDNPNFANTFLLVNRMRKDATAALLKAYVPDKVASGKIFKNVDTSEEMV